MKDPWQFGQVPQPLPRGAGTGEGEETAGPRPRASLKCAAAGSGWLWGCTGEGWDPLFGAEGRHARILITTSTGACQGPRAPANQSAWSGRGGDPQDWQPQGRCPQFSVPAAERGAVSTAEAFFGTCPALSSRHYLQPVTLALGPQCCAAQHWVFSTGLEHLAEVLGARDWSPGQPASSRQPEQPKGDCSQRPVGDVSFHTPGIEPGALAWIGFGASMPSSGPSRTLASSRRMHRGLIVT